MSTEVGSSWSGKNRLEFSQVGRGGLAHPFMHWSLSSLLRTVGWLVWMAFCLFQAVAAERVWTGAVSGNWATAGNWRGGVAPKAGDALRFPASARTFGVSNSLAAAFEWVAFDAPYVVTGSPILTKALGGAAGNGEAVVLNRILLREGGELTAAVEFRLDLRGNVVLSGGMNRLHGGLGVALREVISGPGGIALRDGFAQFFDTNTYRGLTVVEAGILELVAANRTVVGRLGSTNEPTRVLPGGTLRFVGAQTVEEDLFIAGEGKLSPPNIFPPRQPLGALQVPLGTDVNLVGRLTLSSNATVVLGNPLGTDNRTRLLVREVVASPDFPTATLTKVGQGRLSLDNLNHFIGVPLHVKEGPFVLYDPDFGSRPPTTPSPPGIRADLRVGVIEDVPNPGIADLYLPLNLRPGQVPPSRVLAENVAVFVGNRSRVIFGPAQRGLGNPLRLYRGTVQLLNPLGARAGEATGWQSGLIEIDGATLNQNAVSKITGVFGIDGQLTIRALTNRATLRFEEGYVLGGDLTVEGGTNVFAGSVGNQFHSLYVSRGTVLAEQAPAALAQVNVIGTEDPGAETARLRVMQGGQFPAGASLEVKRSGVVEMTGFGRTTLGSLILRGGRLNASATGVGSADFGSDSTIVLISRSNAETPLTVDGPWTWSGPVTAVLDLPLDLPPGARLTLVRYNRSDPIPGRFVGLPDGEWVPWGTREVRADYAGGDGNDLVIEVKDPFAAPPLEFSVTGDGVLTLKWPSASGCVLQFRPDLASLPDWTPLPSGVSVDGMVTHTVPTAAAAGYYRLDCP